MRNAVTGSPVRAADRGSVEADLTPVTRQHLSEGASVLKSTTTSRPRSGTRDPQCPSTSEPSSSRKQLTGVSLMQRPSASAAAASINSG
jgi:hypothetical protein